VGRSSLLRFLVPVVMLGACTGAPPVAEQTRLSASESERWEFVDGGWLVGETSVGRSHVSERFPLGRMSVTVVMSSDEPSGTAASVLIAGLQQGVGRFDLGQSSDPSRWSVLPPPSRGASRSFAVLSVRAEGVTVAAPGGAEIAVPCGACADTSDWGFDGVADALVEAAVDEVLVAFSPTVPWGAVLAGVDTAGDRQVRIARGE
jgi:hypothetical protein